MFNIETDVQPTLPTPNSYLGCYASYPFRKLNIGDSFIVPKELAPRVRRAAHCAGKRQNKKFRVQTQPDGCVRCWRTV